MLTSNGPCDTLFSEQKSHALSRPRSTYLRADLKVSVPAALAAELDLLLEDPLTRRRKYGSLSRLVEALLREWLAAQKGESIQPIPSIAELQA